MNLAVWVLLAIACLSVAMTALGVLLSRNPYQALHFLAPSSNFATVAIAAAILLQESFGQAGIKAILTMLVLFIMNPVLTHATARAARIQRSQQRARSRRP